MSKIINRLNEEYKFEIVEHKKPIKSTIINIQCECGKANTINLGTLYRYLNKKKKYICLSCANKNWEKKRTENHKHNMVNKWRDPKYAGTIIGKAIAREITKDNGLAWLSDSTQN